MKKFLFYIQAVYRDPSKAWDYTQGEYRIFCDRYIPFLLRGHVVEQFIWRIEETPAKDCVKNKSCLCCGCDSPAVQYASRACEVEKRNVCSGVFGLIQCYPKMMNRKDWKKFKEENNIHIRLR